MGALLRFYVCSRPARGVCVTVGLPIDVPIARWHQIVPVDACPREIYRCDSFMIR